MGLKIGNMRIGSGEKAISLLVACSLAYYPLTYAINEIVNRYIQYGAWWDSALCAGIYFLIVLMAFPLIVKRQTIYTLIAFFVAIIIFLVTIVFDLDGAVYAYRNFLTYFLMFFPFLFVGLAIRDFNDLDKKLDVFSRIVIVAAVIWIVIIVFNVNRGLRVAYMSISYYVLPSCLLRIYYYFRDKGHYNFAWMIVSLLCHVIWGTRGPILFAFIFLALCILWNNQNKKGAVTALLLSFVVVLVYHNFFAILQWTNQIFLNLGLQNGGIIKLLTESDLTDGRIDLLKRVLPYINDHIVLGGGIYCDRLLLNGYVHLLPVELVCDFGFFLGILLFIVLLGYIIKTCLIIRDFRDFRWAILWIAIIVGFAKLFLSGSYLEEPYFYFLFGLIANLRSQIQEKENEGTNS